MNLFFFKQNETLAGVRSLCVWTTEACFWEFSCTHDAEEEGVCFKQASNHFYIFFLSTETFGAVSTSPSS